MTAPICRICDDGLLGRICEACKALDNRSAFVKSARVALNRLTQEERKALFTSFGLNAPLDFIQKLPPSAQMGALIGGLLGGALGLAVDEKTIDALPKVGPSLPKRHGEPLHEETMPVNHLHLDVVVHNVHHNLVRAIDTFDRNTGEKNEYKLIVKLEVF